MYLEFVEREKFKDKIGIYSIKNLVNGKRYVGQTGENFQRRFLHHQWSLKSGTHSNQHLQKAFNKYGEENFVFEVVEITDKKELLDQLEIKHIEKDMENGVSYNILHGGGGRRGYQMLDSTKKLIGAKNHKNMFGKKHSEETKKKMSIARTGNTYFKKRVSTLINEDIAKAIKIRIMSGEPPTQIAKDMDISYHVVNGILSNNTWSCAYVEGWDEFQKSRKRRTRLSKEEQENIYNLYKQNISLKDIAEKCNREIHTVRNTIKKYKANDDPVLSLG